MAQLVNLIFKFKRNVNETMVAHDEGFEEHVHAMIRETRMAVKLCMTLYVVWWLETSEAKWLF
jgi:hypothetical protein